MAFTHGASAGELGCGACQDVTWDGAAKLDQIGTVVEDEGPSKLNMPQLSRTVKWNESLHGFGDSTGASADSPQAARQQVAGADTSSSEPESAALYATAPAAPVVSTSQRDSIFSDMMAPISSVSDFDVILDVSNGAKKYIPGAIHIDYMDFLENSKLKPVSVLSQILGDAGISRNDNLLIYGECQPCGGGPSVSTYVYWMMKYLGHERVKILDGGIDDWTAEGLPAMNVPATLPKANYMPELRTSMLASYDYVKNSGSQIVDSRTAEEYEAGCIPGAVNIPYGQVMEKKHIKDKASLETIFAGLSQDRPVVVYTTSGIKASMTWFALSVMGYDAKIYSWNDWVNHLPKPEDTLTNVSAAQGTSADSLNLTAAFRPLESAQTNKSMNASP